MYIKAQQYLYTRHIDYSASSTDWSVMRIS